jgi:hypothetical protein
MILRIIYILHFVFGIVGGTLLLCGGLLPIAAHESWDRRGIGYFWAIVATTAAYWGFWLVRWTVTGLGCTEGIG